MMLGRQWHNETLFWVPETNFRSFIYMLSFNIVPFQNHPYLSAFLLVLERDQTKSSKPAIGNTIVKMGLLQQLLVLQVGCCLSSWLENPRCWWVWNAWKTWQTSHGHFCQFWRVFFFHGNILGFPHEKGHVSQKDGPHKFHSFKPQMLDRRGAKASKRSSATWKGEVIQVRQPGRGETWNIYTYKRIQCMVYLLKQLPRKSTKSS